MNSQRKESMDTKPKEYKLRQDSKLVLNKGKYRKYIYKLADSMAVISTSVAEPPVYSSNPNRINRRNDIKPIHSIKALERVNLDFDSPRLK